MQLRLGGSLHIGEGEYNAHYTYGASTSREELGGSSFQYFLLSAELVVTGPSEDAIGLESYVLQERRAAGESISLEPRFGVESEVISDWLRLRAGSYYEAKPIRKRQRSNPRNWRIRSQSPDDLGFQRQYCVRCCRSLSQLRDYSWSMASEGAPELFCIPFREVLFMADVTWGCTPGSPP